MPNLNDAILAATGGPTVNDGLRVWYSVGVASPQNYALNDLERAWLKIQNPTSPATTVNDLWMDYLDGVGGIVKGTLNEMQRQYWVANAIAPPPLGANEHYFTVGNGVSAYGFLAGSYGALTPLTVGTGTASGLYCGSNDILYLEFVGGVQLAGVLNIEVRTPDGRIICAWDATSSSYKSGIRAGLFDTMASEVDSTSKITIVTL